MQIKFNKLKPTAKADEQNPAPAQQGIAQNPQNPVPAQQGMAQNPQNPAPAQQSMTQDTQAYQRYAQQAAASKMDELPNPPKADVPQAAPTPTPSAAAPTAAPTPAPAPSPAAVPVAPTPAIVPAGSRPMGVKLEDTLKQLLNKQVRIYMVDHESVTGRLDIVEDGWIKVCNARSAGSDYYFDEEIINTVNVVRVHVSVNVGKEKYVEFMSEANKL